MIDSPIAWEKYIKRKYIGIHYRHHGRTLDGLDCWGLAILIYREFGIDLLDLESYSVRWSKEGNNYFLENYHKQWSPVDKPRFPDVVLFATTQHVASHAGIVMADRWFMHSIKNVGVVMTRLSDRAWASKIVGYFRNKLI